jgi:hypothetical protein
MDQIYVQTVNLLLDVVTVVFKAPCFAMNCGSDINLFVQDMWSYALWCLENERQILGSSVPRIEPHRWLDSKHGFLQRIVNQLLKIL